MVLDSLSSMACTPSHIDQVAMHMNEIRIIMITLNIY